MEFTNVFEMATRMKFRFPFRGMISVEDLWDLDVEQLDVVYKALNKDVQKSQEESLLNASHIGNADLNAKIEIVKYIFQVKQAEEEERKNAAANAVKRRRILEVLAKKQDNALENMTEEELQAALAELD
jgi:hypothetical protein